MKRFAIFLGGLLLSPAFAEVAPVFYEDAIEYSDVEYDEYGNVLIKDMEAEAEVVQPEQKAVSKVAKQPVPQRTVSGRVTASRTLPSGATANSGRGNTSAASNRVVAARTTTTGGRASAAGRAVTSRATTTAATATRGTATRAGATNAAAVRATGVAGTSTRAVGATRARATTGSGATRVARAGTTSSIIQTDTVQTPLYNGRSGRVSVRGSSVGSAARSPIISVQSSGITTTTTDASAAVASTSEMDELAELTDYCKAQYANCMDNYCNVLDDNQGRCSCSANLKNYTKTEAALEQATAELQEVARKIQYIGLDRRSVETIFSETEAEIAMKGTSDSTQLKTSLDKIKDMIIDVQSNSGSSSVTSGLGFDFSGLLDFTIDSTGFDLSAFLGTGTGNTSSIRNQRGENLYKTAAARCKANVLKNCTAQGVDASVVTNSYDLEIDKECVAYERSLNESNKQMLSTVANAKNVLQRARLLVQQQKNEYDMRGCINALDECMQDEFVCGSDYENCLDPTGRYIVNGAVVIGSQPGHVIDPQNTLTTQTMSGNVCKVNVYRTWDYPNTTCNPEPYTPNTDQNNAWGTGSNDNLAQYISKTVTDTAAKTQSTNMSEFLQNKIGYVDTDKDINYGMCVSVLNKCQDFSYKKQGSKLAYDPQNDVIKQYLNRTLVQIKAKQDTILADYAEKCVSDVQSCLSSNNYPSSDENQESDYSIRRNVAINACRSYIVTCMSVNGFSIDTPTPAEMSNWVCGITGGGSVCLQDYSETETPSYTQPYTFVAIPNETEEYTVYAANNNGWYSTNCEVVNTCTADDVGQQVTSITVPSTSTGQTFNGYYYNGAMIVDQNGSFMSPLLVSLPEGNEGESPINPSENISDNVIYKMSFNANVSITPNTASSGSKAAQSDDGNSSDSMSKIVINAIYYDNTDKNWYYQQSISGGDVVYKDFSSMKVVVKPSDHYTFKGYYTGENGKGTQIIDKDGLLTNNASVTKAGNLYKYESAESYTIEYELKGGTNYAGAPTEYSYGTGTTINGTPTRANSTFAGWCDNAELTQNCATTRTILDTDSGDKTFYAKWTWTQPQSFALVWQGATASDCDNAYTVSDSDQDITCNASVKHGTFNGWSSDDGEVKADGNSSTVVIKANATGNKSFTANITCNNGYSLDNNGNCTARNVRLMYRFNPSGSGTAPADVECTYGQSYTLPADQCNNGYTLEKWTTAKGDYSKGQQITCDETDLGISGTGSVLIAQIRGSCNSVPTEECSQDNPSACTTAEECEQAGGTWRQERPGGCVF